MLVAVPALLALALSVPAWAAPSRMVILHPGERAGSRDPRVARLAPAGDTAAGAVTSTQLRPFPHDLVAAGARVPPPRPVRDLLRAAPAAAGQAGVLRLAIFRVDFTTDSAGDQTTGDGRFDLRSGVTGVPVDPPPHDKPYFQMHAEALRRFYDVQSYGTLDIQATVFPADPQGAYHLADTGTYGPWIVAQDQVVVDLAETFVNDAIGAVDASGDVDFTQFDAFVVVHAGADFQGDVDRNTPFDIPSFTITLADSVPVGGGATKVGRVLVLPETTSQDERVAALNGVFAHEFGHVLGLPDLYNIYNGIPQVGYWSLMDSGENIAAYVVDPDTQEEFLAEGIFPTSFDPWSKLQLFPETMDVLRVEEAWDGNLEATEADSLLPLVEADPTEYFLVENRALDLDGNGFPFVFQDSTTGVFLGPVDDPDNPGAGGHLEYDAVLPGGGVLIWHIDDKLVIPGLAQTGAVNFRTGIRGVAVEEADGVWDQGRYNLGRPEDPFYLGNNTRFCPDTIPNSATNDGSWTGICIEIGSAPARFMAVSIRRAMARNGWPVPVREDDQVTTTLGSLVTADLGNAQGPGTPDGVPEVVFYAEARETGNPTPTRGLFQVDAGGTPYNGGTLAYVTNPLRPALVASTGFVPDDRGPALAVIGGVEQSRPQLWDVQGQPLLGASNPTPAQTPPVLLAPSDRPGWIEFAGMGILYARQAPGGVSFADTVDTALGRLPTTGVTQLRAAQGPAIGLGPQPAAVGFQGGILAFFDGSGNAPPPVFLSSDVTDLVSGVIRPEGTPVFAAFTADSVAIVSGNGGGVLDAWPLPAGLARPPVVGDVDGDQRSELILADTTGTVAARNADGSFALGWPQHVVPPVRDLELVDLDGDGAVDVLALDGNGRLQGWNGRGRTLDSYPRALGAYSVVDARVEDLDGDGRLTWVATVAEGALVAARMPGAQAVPGDWRMPGGRPEGGNTQAVPGNVAVATDAPDLEGNPLLVYPNPARGDGVEIRFLLDSLEIASLRLFDLGGTELTDARLDLRGGMKPGENAVRWDLAGVAPGLYLCRLERHGPDGDRVDVAKIVVVR